MWAICPSAEVELWLLLWCAGGQGWLPKYLQGLVDYETQLCRGGWGSQQGLCTGANRLDGDFQNGTCQCQYQQGKPEVIQMIPTSVLVLREYSSPADVSSLLSGFFSPVSVWVCVCVCDQLLQPCQTLQTYGLQPARLLCQWDSSGENTGVGNHHIPQGIFPTQGSNPGLCVFCFAGEVTGEALTYVPHIFKSSVFTLVFYQTSLYTSPCKAHFHSLQLYGFPGCIPSWFSKPGVWGLIFPIQNQRVGAPDVEFGSLAPQGIQVFFHPLLLDRLYSSSFLVSFRGNYSTCAYRFAVSTGGDKFRVFQCCHLEPSPQKYSI